MRSVLVKVAAQARRQVHRARLALPVGSRWRTELAQSYTCAAPRPIEYHLKRWLGTNVVGKDRTCISHIFETTN